MMTKPICRDCGAELNDENWIPSYQKKNNRICKTCCNERQRRWRKENPEKAKVAHERWRKANPEKVKAARRRWRKENPEKVKVQNERDSRNQGHRPFNRYKDCTQYLNQYLGVRVAEQVLIPMFKDVERMPYSNPGFNFICNHEKKIGVKSSCIAKDGNWHFCFNRNTIPDYFFCLAFDNRENLTPLHAWLIPGEKVNHLTGTAINSSTIHKWDAYRLDVAKITTCCDAIRTESMQETK